MRHLVGFWGAVFGVVVLLCGCTEEQEAGDTTIAWCETDYPSVFSWGPYAAVSFPEPLIGTVVKDGIHRTTNAGVTWTTQERPNQYSTYTDVVFTDVNTGTIVGAAGTVLRTTDGGETWAAQDSGTPANLHGVSFADANEGVVVGSEGTIVRTTDGGDTWSPQVSGTAAELRGVWVRDTNTATAVGAGGTILQTINGGVSWDSRESGTNAQLNAVSFASGSTGVVVAEDGAILGTTDGGTSWTQSHDFGPLALNDVWFATESVATVVGDAGTILRTTDGGASWVPEIDDAAYWHWSSANPVSVRVEKNIEGVSMPDAEHGFAVGEAYCVLQRTTVSDKYEICNSYCQRTDECYPEQAEGCEIDCLCELRYSYNASEECELAYAEMWMCLLALTCEEIEAFYDDWRNHVCTAAALRVDMVCGR